jgi:outer membrane protein assembly factor BamE (lipoprotein component of BamABCDE complex)
MKDNLQSVLQTRVRISNVCSICLVFMMGAGCTPPPSPSQLPPSLSPEFVQPNYAKWKEIQPGMSEEQVNAILGKPLILGNHSPEFGAFYSTYGMLRYATPELDQDYTFDVEFDTKTLKVMSKTDPFKGDLSLNGIPTKPKLILPTEGQIFDHYPRFVDLRWQPASGTYPMEYEIQFKALNGMRGDWDSLYLETITTSEPYLCYSWIGANKGKWRVRARNREGTGEWSDFRMFEFLQ